MARDWHTSEDSGLHVLHLLADETIAIRMIGVEESEREDKIAALRSIQCRFEVPDLGIHASLRGYDDVLWLRPNGTTPSTMRISGPSCPLDVEVTLIPMERVDYARWVTINAGPDDSSPTTESALEVGERLAITRGCADCHEIGADRRAARYVGYSPRDADYPSAPSLVGLCGSRVPIGAGRTRVADRGYLHAKIEFGGQLWRDERFASSCPSHGDLTERQVRWVELYLRSLSPADPSCWSSESEELWHAPSPDRPRSPTEPLKHCRDCHATKGAPAERPGPDFAGLVGSEVEFADGTRRIIDAEVIREKFTGRSPPKDARFRLAPSHHQVRDEEQLRSIISALEHLRDP